MDYLVKIRSVQTPLNGQFSIGANNYIADGRINAILHITRGKEDEEIIITLDDLRAYGYASTLRGNVITCAKVGFIFNFTVI